MSSCRLSPASKSSKNNGGNGYCTAIAARKISQDLASDVKRVPRPASSASSDDTKLNCCKRSPAIYFVFCKFLFGGCRPTSAQWPNPTRSRSRANGRPLIDHSRSGVVYNFGRLSLFVCLSVRR